MTPLDARPLPGSKAANPPSPPGADGARVWHDALVRRELDIAERERALDARDALHASVEARERELLEVCAAMEALEAKRTNDGAAAIARQADAERACALAERRLRSLEAKCAETEGA